MKHEIAVIGGDGIGPEITKEALKAAILLVDHNMETALELADYVYVVDMGEIRVHGPKSEFDLTRIKNIIQECLMGA